MNLTELATQRLEKWQQQGLLRTPIEFAGPQTPRAQLNDQPSERILLSSSNYLGLATHPEVIAAARSALEKFGTGSGGSRLTTGSTTWHRRIERELANFVGFEDAVLFATGYQANLSVLQTLAHPNLHIFSDSLNHASLIDGIRLATTSGTKKTIYPHCDYTALEQQLAECTARYKLVVSDGVFSMDGDIADLARLREICTHHDAWLLVDDAHGIGTVGKHGIGSTEVHNTRPDILIVTASKALGAEGGFVACSTPVANLLRNQARGYVYSTACSAANCAAISAALEVIRQPLTQQHPVVRLQQRAAALREITGIRVFDGVDSDSVHSDSANSDSAYSPIVPLPVGAESSAVRLASELADRGFHIPAIRYPTVARGQAILRATAMATLELADIKQFAQTLRDLGWRPPTPAKATSPGR